MRELNKHFSSLKSILLYILLLTFIFSCKKIENEPETDRLKTFKLSSTNREPLNIGAQPYILSDISIGYDLTNSLPTDYVKDGSVDYTRYLQDGIKKHTILTMPAFPIMINEKGLLIPSDREIHFINGSKLIAKPTDKGNYDVIRMELVKNIKIYNANIQGDFKQHIGNEGEWGMGISIMSCENIIIDGGYITECWGDGIYVGSTNYIDNKNILIKNINLQKNRRSGISVITADSLILESITAGNSTGTKPMTGINIEPHHFNHRIRRIYINNSKTEYNGRYGIQIGVSKMYGGRYDKFIELTINNHYDKRSNGALKISTEIIKRKNKEKIIGNYIVNNPYWREPLQAPLLVSNTEPNVTFTLNNPSVAMVGGTLISKEEMMAMFTHKNAMAKGAKYFINIPNK